MLWITTNKITHLCLLFESSKAPHVASDRQSILPQLPTHLTHCFELQGQPCNQLPPVLGRLSIQSASMFQPAFVQSIGADAFAFVFVSLLIFNR